MTVIILSSCPECGCTDIRPVPYQGTICFKCGHKFPPQGSSVAWIKTQDGAKRIEF